MLRSDVRPDGDVEVPVEFAPGHTPGFAFFGIQEEMAELIVRRVERQTLGLLSRYFRDRDLAAAEVLYAA